jgi:hypothetical protein
MGGKKTERKNQMKKKDQTVVKPMLRKWPT